MITPFDLHVLSTPPAFILSQDQTLEFIFFDPVQNKLGFFFTRILYLVVSFWYFFFWKIFGIFQGCITVYLSRFNAVNSLRKRTAKECSAFFISVPPYMKYEKHNGDGGIWTLAPLLTTCTLSRGVPSAILGTSPNKAKSILSSSIIES